MLPLNHTLLNISFIYQSNHYPTPNYDSKWEKYTDSKEIHSNNYKKINPDCLP